MAMFRKFKAVNQALRSNNWLSPSDFYTTQLISFFARENDLEK